MADLIERIQQFNQLQLPGQPMMMHVGTANLVGSTSAGGSGVGFGLSFGTSWVDEECQKMEAARNAPTPGDRVHVWCQSKFAAASPSCAKGAAAAKTGSVAQPDVRASAGSVERMSAPAVTRIPGWAWENGQWVAKP
jgi:hypothetical protein